ncbi:cytochrome P450 [Colletotrichum zoysiae]|uniref:Cytochrome P450 n=1 Tax=Colletotrichum zoysiae TaxID=1216348 RepID=A0AAD9HJ41_9PEZI|nr:cytochrome P450 [Colletotrichum zoysiae]
MAGLFFIPAVVAAVCVLMRLVYRSLLPKRLPGIPCNKDSSTRLLGDTSYFMEIRKSGGFWLHFFTDLLSNNKTPIAQFFPGPLSGNNVVIGDYREARDLMTKRNKDLGRGYKNIVTWQGVLPGHIIGMESFHPSYKEASFLTKDLMTPNFLHRVSAPASYKTVSNFIKLWKVKAAMADGLPFEAADDLEGLTYDIITAAAFGAAEENSQTLERLRAVQKAEKADSRDNGSFRLALFPRVEKPELLAALNVLTNRAGTAFQALFPKIALILNGLRPSVRHAYRSKGEIIQSYIDLAVKKLSRGGSNEEFHSAVDYVVSREASAAESAGRRPVFNSIYINDMLAGYLVAGQDSTHSTLSFAVKYLTAHQDVQSKLRSALRFAYPEADEQGRQPTVEEVLKTQIPFLDAFIEETLRMVPPAAAITRQVLCDMTVFGNFIPKGTLITFLLTGPTMTMAGAEVEETKRGELPHKISSEGVDDWSQSPFPPGEFQPERWLRADESGNVKYDSMAGPFLSFGSGPRGCWGKRLAYLELKLVVTLLVWNLEFMRLPDGMEDDGIIKGLVTKPKLCCVKLRNTTSSTS